MILVVAPAVNVSGERIFDNLPPPGGVVQSAHAYEGGGALPKVGRWLSSLPLLRPAPSTIVEPPRVGTPGRLLFPTPLMVRLEVHARLWIGYGPLVAHGHPLRVRIPFSGPSSNTAQSEGANLQLECSKL